MKDDNITGTDFSPGDAVDMRDGPDVYAIGVEIGIVDGIVAELGRLGPGAIVFEAGLCTLFRRHRASVKRAIQRHELPEPTRLFGQPCWTVKALVDHFEARLSAAAKERERLAEKISRLRP